MQKEEVAQQQQQKQAAGRRRGSLTVVLLRIVDIPLCEAHQVSNSTAIFRYMIYDKFDLRENLL